VTRRFGPYGKIQILKAEVNRLVDLLLEGPATNGPGWLPPVDIIDCPDTLTVAIEVPGLNANDLVVELMSGVLIVRGTKRRLPSEPPARRFHLMERFIGSFQVVVDLPHPIDPGQGKATLRHGVLNIVFPRLEDRRQKPFKIPVTEETEPHD
jgi:HSP20 family protein